MALVYDLEFPDHLDGYEAEVEAKGYLEGVKVNRRGSVYELTIYDPVRLGQEVADEVAADGSFAVANLVVVDRVTREEISRAVERQSRSDFSGLASTTAPAAG